MATASIIADGTTEANSSDFTLAAGETTTISLRGTIPTTAMVRIQCKQSDGSYTDFGTLTSQFPVVVLTAVGVFRVVRRANAASFGVDRA